MSEVPPASERPTLRDRWERRAPIPLDGPLERHAFNPLLLAGAGLIAAFVLFQLIISPLATIVLLMMQGVQPADVITSFGTVAEEHARSLLAANTIGQILGLALPAYLLARLHTTRPWAFVRMRGGDGGLIVLAVIGLVALTPFIQWIGVINEQLPLPESIRQFEQSQMELIERVLSVDTGFFFNLLVLAVTPALCEEILFRGYVQRQFERGTGVVAGIVLSGIVFGLYHLRLTQAIPLCVLGIYLAWLAWRTGSLWPAIVVHFMNNAIAVAIGAYIAGRDDVEVADIESMEMPWYLVASGLVIFAAVIVGMTRRARRIRRVGTGGEWRGEGGEWRVEGGE